MRNDVLSTIAGNARVRSSCILSIFALGCIVVQPVQARWTPANPQLPVVRVRLRDTQGPASDRGEQQKSYFLVTPGDTLTFRLSGEGDIQIQARPIYREEDNAEVFRYSIWFDSGPRRNFKRRSAVAGTMIPEPVGQPASLEPVVVGSKNRLIVAVTAESQLVHIAMNEKDARSAFVRVLLGEGVLQRRRRSVASKPSSEFRKSVRVSPASYDSNAYLAPKGSIPAKGVAYWPLDAQLLYRSRPTRRLVLDAQYRFAGEFHEQSLLDESSHTLGFEQRLRATSPRSRRVTLVVAERWRYRTTTFFGRGEQEEFETLQDGEAVSLAGRFDYNESQVQGRVETEISSRVLATVRATYTSRNYREDFADYPGLYALDNSRRDLGASIRWNVMDQLRVEINSSIRLKEYREKFARNAQGVQQVNQPTSLSSRKLSARLRLAPPAGLQLALGLSGGQTLDLFESYWDHSRLKVSSMVGWRWRRGNGLRVTWSRSAESHENATVGYDPTQPLRRKTVLRIGVDAQYVLTPRVSVALVYDYQDQDNNSLRFAYRRWQFSNGFVVRY